MRRRDEGRTQLCVTSRRQVARERLRFTRISYVELDAGYLARTARKTGKRGEAQGLRTCHAVHVAARLALQKVQDATAKAASAASGACHVALAGRVPALRGPGRRAAHRAASRLAP